MMISRQDLLKEFSHALTSHLPQRQVMEVGVQWQVFQDDEIRKLYFREMECFKKKLEELFSEEIDLRAIGWICDFRKKQITSQSTAQEIDLKICEALDFMKPSLKVTSLFPSHFSPFFEGVVEHSKGRLGSFRKVLHLPVGLALAVCDQNSLETWKALSWNLSLKDQFSNYGRSMQPYFNRQILRKEFGEDVVESLQARELWQLYQEIYAKCIFMLTAENPDVLMLQGLSVDCLIFLQDKFQKNMPSSDWKVSSFRNGICYTAIIYRKKVRDGVQPCLLVDITASIVENAFSYFGMARVQFGKRRFVLLNVDIEERDKSVFGTQLIRLQEVIKGIFLENKGKEIVLILAGSANIDPEFFTPLSESEGLKYFFLKPHYFTKVSSEKTMHGHQKKNSQPDGFIVMTRRTENHLEDAAVLGGDVLDLQGVLEGFGERENFQSIETVIPPKGNFSTKL